MNSSGSSEEKNFDIEKVESVELKEGFTLMEELIGKMKDAHDNLIISYYTRPVTDFSDRNPGFKERAT